MLPGVYLLTGPNGSGKSSAAQHLADTTPGAQLLSAETQQAFYERELAEDESNFRGGADLGKTVHDLLGDAGRAHPLYRALRLSELGSRGYRQLSTGESRKVLLLRALAAAPPLIVLDDPFEGLDHAACAELRDALALVAAETAVLVVGTFVASHSDTRRLLPLELVREVRVLGPGGAEVFRGPLDAWLAHAPEAARAHLPPPVDDGPWHADDTGFAPGQALIVLRSGRVAYGEHVIFDGLDLTVRAGEHTLIEGPNGSGKSTLLELFTGDHPQAYANDLTLFGRRRGSGESVWDVKRRVGLVSGRLHRDYRVSASVETVLLSGLFDSIGLYETPGPRARARAQQWLRWLDLGLRPDDPFRELSFGVQRLLLVARAAIKVPPLVVLDEPTAGLDAENRARVLELVRSLGTQSRSTLLFVTHRPDERAWWDQMLRGPRVTLR
ncbi:MAG: ATP-binding cassette domain-containing protein [Sandaracinaceae bacterium]|nr:ATP-binding cassette domain-containing protein [Sandaracinaceae bacterium]